MNVELELEDFDDKIETHQGLQKHVQAIANTLFLTPARVVLCLAAWVLALTSIAWNLERMAVLDQLIQLEYTEFDLLDELGDLQLKVSGIDPDTLAAELQQESSKVFQGFPYLAAWNAALAETAAEHNIALQTKVGDAHHSAVPGILEVPVLLILKGNTQGADNFYQVAMQLVGRVLRDHWHIDVISTQATGDGTQMVQLTIQAQVWVRDRFGFVDAEALVAEPESVDGLLDG